MVSNTELKRIPGITLRSVVASIFCMVVMGMHIQFVEVLLSDGSAFAEQSLPIPAITVFIVVALLTGLLGLATKFRLLTRAELFCVLFTMLISGPMMTQGMWHRFVGIIAATPHTSRFKYIDAYNDKLWPHGQNLVPNAFNTKNQDAITVTGNKPEWKEEEYEKGHKAVVPILRNVASEKAAGAQEEISALTVKIALEKNGKPYLIPGDPYLASFLAYPRDLATESFYFCRVYYDDDPNYTEIINSKEKSIVTFVHKMGWLRVGNYGVRFAANAKKYVRLQIGLSGPGTLMVYDPKLFSVAALEAVYKGKTIIPASEYAKLPPNKRAGLIPKPDKMFSIRGLVFLIKGYIPVKDWVQPAISWSVLILLLLAALLCINVVMRKQWAESERYPFPLFQIPNALLGNVEEPSPHALLKIWRNKWMWMGLGASLFWGLMRGWNFYNHHVPDLNINVSLQQYLSDPGWGGMWNTSFIVSAILVSIAIFFELNVLLSLVLGFFLFRCLYWVGQWSGMKVYTGYPFRYEQAIGSYFSYAVVVVFFTRKYLWNVLKSALTGKQKNVSEEAFSYRTALIVLVLCFVGIYCWTLWLDLAGAEKLGIMAYFFFLIVIGFVAAKFRAECGLPVGYFTPYNAMLFVSVLGGMSVFGASGMMVCLCASGFLTVSVFFFIPGAQLELLEFGRRMRLKRRHPVYTVLIGALGGLLIGGWVFLSNSYAIGGNNIKYQWSYNQDWFFSSYRIEHVVTSIEYRRTHPGAGSEAAAGAAEAGKAAAAPERPAATALKPATYAYAFGAFVTVILTLIRQFYAGFRFHPIGFILGSAHMLEWAWGSCLVALVIRSVVLKLGGAHTVKNKLLPFFVGVFVGGVLTCIFFNVYGFILRAQGVDRIYGALP